MTRAVCTSKDGLNDAIRVAVLKYAFERVHRRMVEGASVPRRVRVEARKTVASNVKTYFDDLGGYSYVLLSSFRRLIFISIPSGRLVGGVPRRLLKCPYPD